MNDAVPARARMGTGTFLLAIAVVALVGYYLWSRPSAAPPAVTAVATPDAVSAAPRAPATADAGLPPGAHEEDGILVDAQGQRILNAAGLPPGPPLPPAKPIPIKAAPGEIVGYSTDAKGVSHPMRAGDIKTAANTPGTYAVVDMWANGGPTVVAPTQGQHLTEAEVAKRRAAEAARDAASSRKP